MGRETLAHQTRAEQSPTRQLRHPDKGSVDGDMPKSGITLKSEDDAGSLGAARRGALTKLSRALLGPDLGAQCVDRDQPRGRVDVPERPAVAGLEPLRQRADAVDR